MKALIVVDVQLDFVGGNLAVPDAHQIIPVVNKLIDAFDNKEYPIFFTLDSHPANHGSFASVQGVSPFTAGVLDGIPQVFWPDHCVEGTSGAAIHADVDMPTHVQPVMIKKGMDPMRDSYSGFADAGGRATELLAAMGRKRVHVNDEVYVCGLATDYCVKATALDAARLGFNTCVIFDACRGVAPNTSIAAIEELLHADVKVKASKWLTI